MRTLAYFLLALLGIAQTAIFTSCVDARGPGWSLTAVGTDAASIEAAASGFHATDLKNSPALKLIADPILRYITVTGAVKMLRDGLAYLKLLDNNRVALFQAGTDRQIGLVQAKSAADIAQLQAAAATAKP